MSSGTPPSMCTRSKCASAAAAASAPWKRSTIARASARLASRGPVPAGGSSTASSENHVRHRLVGEAQRLAVLLLRRLGHADVVAQRLGHLLDPVGPRQDRHRQDRLLGLAVGALDVAAEQQVERLVGAAELDVGVDRDRVVALQQRVQRLEDRDRLAGL